MTYSPPLQNWRALSLQAACVLIVCGVAYVTWAGDDPSSNESASARSLQRMQRRVASLAVDRGRAGDGKKVELIETAVLRYSNPGGMTATTDGAVWLWGKTGRPAAINAIFFERLPDGDEKWSCELTSLADEPLTLAAQAGWKWRPAQSDLRWQTFADSPEVAETANQRLRQMKGLARQFAVSESFDDSQTDQLRLLVQPLYRYSSEPDHELLDGALFAFAGGTNPEALLLLEARATKGNKAIWHFVFTRMGAAALQARLNEKAVWDCSAIKAWDNRESYYSMFGKDAAVFGKVDDAE